MSCSVYEGILEVDNLSHALQDSYAVKYHNSFITRVGNTRRSCGQFLVTFLSDRCEFDLRRSCWPVPFLTLYKFFRSHLFAWCTIRTKNQLKWPRNLLMFISNVTRRIAFSVLFSQLVRIQYSLIARTSARSPLSKCVRMCNSIITVTLINTRQY